MLTPQSEAEQNEISSTNRTVKGFHGCYQMVVSSFKCQGRGSEKPQWAFGGSRGRKPSPVFSIDGYELFRTCSVLANKPLALQVMTGKQK